MRNKEEKSLLRNGNSKLGNEVLAWSLPPMLTCSPSTWCSRNCYAQKGRFKTSVVSEALTRNFNRSIFTDFPEKIIQEIKSSNKDKVRIHVSGDFYNNTYIQYWIDIVKACPDVTFLAFTRQVKFRDKLLELASLPNMVLLESLDDSISNRGLPEIPKASIQGDMWTKESDRKCNMGCQECNYLCWTSPDKDVAFEKH